MGGGGDFRRLSGEEKRPFKLKNSFSHPLKTAEVPTPLPPPISSTLPAAAAVLADAAWASSSSPWSLAPAPAGTNPRPLPLEHPCLGSFFLSPKEALLVEAVWADVAARSLPPPVLRRRFGA